MDYQAFVAENVAEIKESVGDGLAINAPSGGVDSSVVTPKPPATIEYTSEGFAHNRHAETKVVANWMVLS